MNAGWDAVVVGAGPAGAVAARQLAQRGRRVLLVERARLPRDTVCGGCLHPRGEALLRALGLGAALDHTGALPLHTLTLRCGRRRLSLARPLGRAVVRAHFDQALARAACAAGAELAEQTRAQLAPSSAGDGRLVQLTPAGAPPTVVRADLVIAADGLGSPLLRAATEGPTARADATGAQPDSHLGLGALVSADALCLPPGEVCFFIDAAGYLGCVRLPDGRVDLAAALSPAALRAAGGPAPAVATLLRRCGATREAEVAREAAWLSTPALTRRPVRASAPRVLAVGDAAGFVEPFTGEGMTWALEAGALLGELAGDGWDATLARRWERGLRARLGPSRRRCRRVARLVRHPRAVALGLALLKRIPGAAGALLAAGHGTARA